MSHKHILVAVDYDQDEERAFSVFSNTLSSKYNLHHKKDYESHTLCEGKFLFRFPNISCSDFQNICSTIYQQPNALSENRYKVMAYPDNMHSLPSDWYKGLCRTCIKLENENHYND